MRMIAAGPAVERVVAAQPSQRVDPGIAGQHIVRREVPTSAQRTVERLMGRK